MLEMKQFQLRFEQLIPGRWHFYIATVLTDEAVHVERLLKNMAAAVIHKAHKVLKKRTVAIEAI